MKPDINWFGALITSLILTQATTIGTPAFSPGLGRGGRVPIAKANAMLMLLPSYNGQNTPTLPIPPRFVPQRRSHTFEKLKRDLVLSRRVFRPGRRSGVTIKKRDYVLSRSWFRPGGKRRSHLAKRDYVLARKWFRPAGKRTWQQSRELTETQEDNHNKVLSTSQSRSAHKPLLLLYDQPRQHWFRKKRDYVLSRSGYRPAGKRFRLVIGAMEKSRHPKGLLGRLPPSLERVTKRNGSSRIVNIGFARPLQTLPTTEHRYKFDSPWSSVRPTGFLKKKKNVGTGKTIRCRRAGPTVQQQAAIKAYQQGNVPIRVKSGLWIRGNMASKSRIRVKRGLWIRGNMASKNRPLEKLLAGINANGSGKLRFNNRWQPKDMHQPFFKGKKRDTIAAAQWNQLQQMVTEMTTTKNRVERHSQSTIQSRSNEMITYEPDKKHWPRDLVLAKDWFRPG